MKIALLAMPFLAPEFPSLGLTQIKSRLKEIFKDQVDVDLFYLNHDFIQYFGYEFYMNVFYESTFTSINDWLFRQEAFDNLEYNHKEYLSRFYPNKNFDNNSIETFMNLGYFIDETIEAYHLTSYDLTGSSATYSTVPGLAFCRHLKRKKKEILTVMGGASLYKEMGETLSKYYPYIDYVCSGPGLISFPQLIDGIIKNDNNVMESIDGIFSKNNLGKVGKVSEELDINHDIHLDYDDFFESFYKFNLHEIIKPRILLETSRGCYWRKCKFCGLNEDQLKYRVKRVEKAIEEINRYSVKYNCDISMVDNIMPRHYIKKVLPNLHIKPGRAILYEVKADYNEEEIKILSQANLKKIQPGIESLHSNILEQMDKGINAFQCIDVLKQCIRYNITPGWNLIIGFPNMTEEMYKELIATIPLLTHLFPPDILTPVRFDRYSVYRMESEKYNLELSPFSAYKYIYPYDHEFLSGIAYYFEDRNFTSDRFQLMSEYHLKINTLVNCWKKRWQTDDMDNTPKLYCRVKEGTPFIYDSRQETTKEYDISLLEEKILKLLESPMAIDDIEISFPGENQGNLVGTLNRLEDKDLIFKENDRCMSLVIQPIS
jgi:ribosomal peptide maturation radical SAM protein 1